MFGNDQPYSAPFFYKIVIFGAIVHSYIIISFASLLAHVTTSPLEICQLEDLVVAAAQARRRPLRPQSLDYYKQSWSCRRWRCARLKPNLTPSTPPSWSSLYWLRMAAVVVSVLVVVVVIVTLCLCKRRTENDPSVRPLNGNNSKEENRDAVSMQFDNRQFSYKELKTVTNSFKKSIGKGRFGVVCLGYL